MYSHNWRLLLENFYSACYIVNGRLLFRQPTTSNKNLENQIRSEKQSLIPTTSSYGEDKTPSNDQL